MVDLKRYAAQILADEDHPLFDDAVQAAKVDALRAAYVMIWLACAESLKRRFREAQQRDGAAGRIVGDIEAKEKEHKSVDKLVLDKAKEYGFLSDPAHTVLNHVYEMRCLYGHPYEAAPSPEQVSHAAAVVVEYVLSQPVKLRHGFGNQLLASLLGDRTYLDDQEAAVAAFAKDIIPRLDERIHGWFLDKYWEGLEKLADDSSMAAFFRRGMWFCCTMLAEIGVDAYSHDEWHDRISRFPKTLMRVCGTTEVFGNIGKRAQDSLVGAVFAEADTRGSVLKHLERLHDGGVLSKRQQERFDEHVARMSSSALRSSGLSTKSCYSRIVAAMASHDWYIQNPAIDLVVSNGPKHAAELGKDQQVNLGRNILQAGEGTAKSANEFLEALSRDGAAWPSHVLRGIALESFTNEKNEIRFKDRHLSEVLTALSHLKVTQRKEIIAEVAASVDAGTPKRRVDAEDFTQVIEVLEAHPWAALLVRALKAKVATLPAAEDVR